MNEPLPESVAEFVEMLAEWARGYNNRLKWNEEAKAKADMMNSRAVWKKVDVRAFQEKCRSVGLRPEDTRALVEMLTKVKAGRRLVPQAGYREYRWNHESAGGDTP